MPNDIPSDIPFPDDMEVGLTAENEVVSQFMIETAMDMKALEEMLDTYLNSRTFQIQPMKTVYDDQNIILYETEYEGDQFEISIINKRVLVTGKYKP